VGYVSLIEYGEYVEQLAQCCGFIDSVLQDCMDSQTEIVVAGDFNCAVKSLLDYDGLIMLSDLLSQYGVKLCDSLYVGQLDYSFRCAARNVFTWIDHIFMSDGLFCNFVNMSIIDDGCNNSDHCIVGVVTNVKLGTVSLPYVVGGNNMASDKQ
jgi:endonuclease/exonuclease/phosphatase family metal-dependent hydrolase